MHALFERTRLPTAALAATLLLFGLLPSSATGWQPEPALVFRDVDVFDGSRMTRRTTVLVRDGMIRAVGAEVAIPPSAKVIDGKGKTLLPGLFDAHTHLGVYQAEQFLRDALDFGVTTELEMWGSEASLTLRRKMAAGGFADMADLRTAGTGVTVPRGHPTQMGGPPVPTLAPGDDAQAFVDARIAEGSDYIKVIYEHAYPTLTKAELEAVVAAAHRRNQLVVVHVTTQRDAHDAIAAGADGLVHVFADSPPESGFAEFAARHHVFVIPTLSVLEAVTGASDNAWWQDARRVGPYITPSMRRSLEMKFPPGFGAKSKLAHAQAAVRALRRAGVPVLAGTDAPAPGLAHGASLHRELELLVLAGLTPLEALASATSEPARAFGFHDRGRIAAGARADLLLVNGDPTVDITTTRDIVGIWKLGVAHTRHSADRPASRP
jgi:imidazolonepropionase-like amidohydrolase